MTAIDIGILVYCFTWVTVGWICFRPEKPVKIDKKFLEDYTINQKLLYSLMSIQQKDDSKK
jgi:hypothetical protein